MTHDRESDNLKRFYNIVEWKYIQKMNAIRRLCLTKLYCSFIKPYTVTSTYRNPYKQSSRFLSISQIYRMGEYERLPPKSDDEIVNVTFIDREKNKIPVQAKVGDNILYLSHLHNIDLEGACEASLSCSTCHVYIDDDYFDSLEEPEDEENDMLDLAIFQTENSRLGCQIHLTKQMDGMKITLPSATRNFYVDGHVPKPH